MRKEKVKNIIAVLAVAVIAIGCAATIYIWGENARDKSNLFAYAIDLENDNWAYAPKGLDYGMTAEEVIRAERLKDYVWEEEGVILRTEKNVKKLFGEIKEFEFVKRYFFDSEGGLASVRYELTMDDDYEEAIRQMLYEQAVDYMPETNRKTEMEDILAPGQIIGETIEATKEMYVEDGEYADYILPVTRVVWGDAVYESEDSDVVLTHANSDVALQIDLQINYQMTVRLDLNRYEERLTEAEIQALREEYEIIDWRSSVLICGPVFPFESTLSEATTFIHTEVTGDSFSYYKAHTNKYYAYPVRVIADTEGMYPVGVEGCFDHNANFENYYDRFLIKGRQFICANGGYSAQQEGDEKKYWGMSIDSAFYVTEDGYVLTAFDENVYAHYFERYVVSESTLCGLTLEDLMRRLKK